VDYNHCLQESISYEERLSKWIYGHLKSGGTVLIFYKFSRCTKGYLQYLSATFYSQYCC